MRGKAGAIGLIALGGVTLGRLPAQRIEQGSARVDHRTQQVAKRVDRRSRNGRKSPHQFGRGQRIEAAMRWGLVGR